MSSTTAVLPAPSTAPDPQQALHRGWWERMTVRGQLQRRERWGRIHVGTAYSMSCAVCACIGFSYSCGTGAPRDGMQMWRLTVRTGDWVMRGFDGIWGHRCVCRGGSEGGYLERPRSVPKSCACMREGCMHGCVCVCEREREREEQSVCRCFPFLFLPVTLSFPSSLSGRCHTFSLSP